MIVAEISWLRNSVEIFRGDHLISEMLKSILKKINDATILEFNIA
jgi:hypothetical protein